jgi:methionyl-tRNA synthetase
MESFYITTPIYYVNDVPHIGHAYTTIAADTLRRYQLLRGRDAYLVTGTDEHGAKMAEAAAAHGQDPQAYADANNAAFRAAWQSLNIGYNDLIRTTEPRHEKGVQKFVQALYDRGQIYKSRYEGLYCTGCERFMTETELVDGCCPDHRRPPVTYAEDNYFFRLSNYTETLLKAIEDPGDPNHFEIDPPTRRNEVLGKLRVGLNDISISRALKWGIPVPFDPSQTVYVWVDALLSYIDAIGYGAESDEFRRYWPASVHLMAKDILWFHTVIWPSMLIAAGLPVPNKVFAHGFFTVNGQKMSKTIGNVIAPQALVERFGTDGARYLMLTAFPFGTDGDISLDSFAEAYNANLANDLGNLLNRTASMINRYFGGVAPAPGDESNQLDLELKNVAASVFPAIERAFQELAFHEALGAAWQLVGRANKYVEENAPWTLAKTNRERLSTVMYNLAESLRLIALSIYPAMPQTTGEIMRQLGLTWQTDGVWEDLITWGKYPSGTKIIDKPQPIFPRLQ